MQKIIFILLALHLNLITWAQNDTFPVSVYINITDISINTYERGTVSYEQLCQRYNLDSLPAIKQKSYELMIALNNTSDKPVYIASMTCSWPEIFMLNNDGYLHFDYEGCDMNIPEIITIGPQQQHYFYATLIEHLWYLKRSQNPTVLPMYPIPLTRIGLRLLYHPHEKSNKNYFTLMQDRSTWSVIWSNCLELYPEKP